MGKFKDLSGKKINFFTVIKRTENQGKKPMWLCKCACGNIKAIRGDNLKNGTIKSCGCYNKQLLIDNKRAVKHGKRKTRLYCIWEHMKQRCYNKNNYEYYLYGGRNITICEEWRNSFTAFYNWALANGYKEELSIDRINNNENYEPNNCRWATCETQANNRRTNHLIEYNGEIHTIAEWAKITGISERKIYDRYIRDNWSVEKTLENK